jgi:DNA-binding transcriptional LysR family regulator
MLPYARRRDGASLSHCRIRRFKKRAATDARVSHSPAAFALRTDSLQAQLMAARTGFGVAVLQRPMAASFPELVDVLPGLPTPSLPIWLAMHKDVRTGAHVRVTHDWLADVMRDYIAHAVTGWQGSRGGVVG